MNTSLSAGLQLPFHPLLKRLTLLAIGTLGAAGVAVAQTPPSFDTVTVSPSSLTFAAQKIGVASSAQTITFTPSSFFPIFFNSVAIGGTNAADFTTTNNCPRLLFDRQSCAISVIFKPTAAGTRAASLSITDSAFGSPQTVSLVGSGLVPLTTLSVSPASLTFPAQNTGTTSTAQSTVISNTGNQPITLSSIGLAGTNAADFIEANTCGPSLAVSATCSISVTFKPSAAGTRTASLTIADNASGSPQSVSLSGIGQLVPTTITVSPTALTFATQNTGTTSATQNVTITNTGNQPVTISSIALGGTNAADFAETNTCPASLAVSGTCAISVTFKPTAAGTRSAAISITDSATGSPQSVSLTGTGQAAPSTTISVSPTALTFATQNTGTTSAAQSVTITNTGNQPVTISSIALGGTNAADFAETNTCPASLAVSGTCAISVTFKPTAAGTRSASLSIADNATGSPQSVSLTGTAQVLTTTISVSPTALTFATQNTGTTSAAQSVTITNTGNQPVTISSIALGGTNAADFAETNTCPASLAVSGTCAISVTFKPTAAGTRTASLNIADNATGSPQSVSLTGTGQVLTTTITVSPTALTFATQNTGTTSAAQNVTITNTGNQPVTISSIALAGTNAADFAETNTCPASLAVSGTCAISVTFKPTAAGTRSASLSIADNATGSPQSVSLAGTGQVLTTTISVSPTALTFATQNTGTTSAAQSVTITNTGNQPVTISSIALGGTNAADFTETNNCPASLAVSGTCSINVTFSPTVAGTRTASLSITDNATGSPQSVTLSGTGQVTATSISLSPGALTFAAQNTGTTSAAQTVTIANTGNQVVTISSLALAGTNAGDFAETNNCGASLAVSATCSISVTFKPTATGARTASITITDNATGSPQTVSLAGTGQAATTTLTLNPTSLTFAAQNVSSTSSAQAIQVTNTGTVALIIGTVAVTGTNAADFAISANTCGSSVGVGAQCQVNVTFTPSAAGTRTAAITFTDNATGSPQSVTLSGTGLVPSTTISVNPASLTFGTQNTGTTSAAQSVTITNTGNQPVSISSIALTGTNPGDFAISANNCPTSLGVGAACSLSAAFSPTAVGTRSAAVTIADNASGSPQTVSLTGTGQTPNPTQTLNPTALAFGSVNVNTSTNLSTTLSNTGNTAISITSIAVSGTNAGDFTAGNNCAGSVASGSNCSISIAFTPSAAGARAATLTITDSGSGSPLTVPLSGTGQIPTQSVSPTALAFGAQNINTGSTLSVTLKNTTGASTSGSISIGSIAVSGTNAGDFTVGNNCAGSLPNGTSCNISVTFTPSAAGARAATLTITDSASGSPLTVPITGTGQAPALTASPTSLAFVAQNINTSTALNVTLTNTTSASISGYVSISSIAVSGANAGDFTVGNNCGGTVSNGTSCNVNVTFTPSAVGARAATLTIANSASATPLTVALTGTGQVPTQSVSPTALAFGAQNINTSSTSSVTLANTTSAATSGYISISSIAISGTNAGDFTVGNNCAGSLSNGTSCNISVTFTPSAVGSRSATLTITDSATGSPLTVPLTGTGQAPALSATPSPLAFGAQNNNTSNTLSITLTNTTSSSISGYITLGSLAVSGANAGDFTVNGSNCGGSISNGTSCQVSVTFTPSAVGARSATLAITNSATTTPLTVPLTGTGQVPTQTATPTPLAFGAQNINSSSTLNVTLKNTTSASSGGYIAISSILVGGVNASDFAVNSNCGTNLYNGNSCTINVTFTPGAVGARSGTLTITDSASGSPLAVSLTGTGQVPTQTASPTSLTFGTVTVSTPSSLTLTLTNTTSASIAGSIAISSILISGTNAGDFAVNSNNCGTSLSNGASCGIYVSFTPGAVGARTAALVITDSAAGSPLSVPLSGTGQSTTTTLSLSPASLNFSGQNVNSTSASQYFIVSNTGTAALSFSSVAVTGTNAGDFAVSTNNCGNSLPASAGCYVFITFTPTAVGTRTAAVTLTDNATGSPQSVALTGTGQAVTSTLTVNPNALAFNGQNLNSTTASQYFYISNTGTAAIAINSIAITGANAGDFAVSSNNCGSTLPANTSCYVYVTFTPSAIGARTAAVTITDSAAGSPQSVALSGTGQTTTTLTFNPASVSFANTNVGATSTQTLTVTNTGTAAASFSSFALAGANPGDFAITANTCPIAPSTLSGGGNCQLTITLTPSYPLARSANLTITDNSANSPQVIFLGGNGAAQTQTLAFSYLNLAFNNQDVGSSSGEADVNVTNTGNTAVNLSSIAITGPNRTDFTISTNQCSSQYGNILVPNRACYVGITFTPAATGARTAAVTYTDNAAGSPQSVALTGNGVTPGAAATLSQTEFLFGTSDVGVASSEQDVYIQNTGNVPLNISAISITGANAGDFTITTNRCSYSYANMLAPNQQCYVGVTFTPTATGARAASLTFTDNAASSPQTVALSGTGHAATETLAVRTPAVFFGGVEVGTSSSDLSTYITNTGSATINISSIAINGANAGDFSIDTSQNRCANDYSNTLAAGQSCSVSFLFTPTAAGNRTAELTITSNATNSPLNVALNGVGLSGDILLTAFPSTLSFSQANGIASAPQTVTLLNSGAQPLTITSAAITGPADYAISSYNCPASSTTLAAGSSCTLQITYTPSAVANTSATLGIISSAGTAAVALNGSGQNPTLTLSAPASAAFGTQGNGITSLAQAITIQNTGTAPITLTNFAVAGTNAGDFSIASNSCGTTLAAATSCTVGVTFTPSASGARAAALTITDDATGSPQSVTLNGTGGGSQKTLEVTQAVAFGLVNLGVASNGGSVTLTNTGSASVNLSAYAITGANAADFAITSNQCTTSYSNVLTSTSACYFIVTFTPSAAGLRTATLQISSDASGSPQTVQLSGTGQSITQTLALSPASLSFGTYTVGVTSGGTVVSITNTGDAPVALTGYTITGTNAADFTVSYNYCTTGYSNTLSSQGSSCYLNLSFTPSVAGLRTATLQIADNATGSPQTILLQGTGQSVTKTFSLSPTSYDFGVSNVGVSVASNNIRVINTGTGSVTFTNYVISGANAADFAITSPNYYYDCSGTRYSNVLTAGGFCYEEVTFTPSAAGVRTATLTFTDDATGSPQTVFLQGTGQSVTKTISISPISYDFGVSNVGVSVVSNNLTATNTGTGNVTFSNYAISGANASDFAITSPNYYYECSGTRYSNVLPAGSFCYEQVTFTPSATGVRTATLTFTDDATGSPQTIALTGEGQVVTTSDQISPTSLLFTSNVGVSGSKYVYFTNTGTANINFTGAAITGTNAADFSIGAYNQCANGYSSTGLPPGTSCYVRVSFTPTLAGTETATLNVTDSVSATPQTVSLTGLGQSIQTTLELSNDYLQFNAAVGSTYRTYVQLTPSGTGSVTLSNLAITGTNASEFTTYSNGCTVGAPLTSACDIVVTFAPLAEGYRTAALQITDDATGTTQNVLLNGNAILPSASISYNSLDFGRVPVNTTSAQSYFYFYNSASTALALSAPTIIGANAADFSIVSTTCATSLATGNSCYIYLTFKPSAPGPRTAAVRVLDSGGTGTQAVVPLAGDGNGGAGYLALDPIGLEFDDTDVSSTSSYQGVTLTNTGNGTANFSAFKLSGANAADYSIYSNQCSTALAPDASCNVYLQFTPSGTGLRSASLQITDDASNTPQSVALIGAGQASAEILYTSTPYLDFGSVNINSGTGANGLSLQSGGTANINLSSIQITGANASEFSLSGNTCATSLSSSCSITIAFSPTAVGAQTANLVITSDAPGSPLTIPLTGAGQPNTAVLSLNYANLDFGVENIGAQYTSPITVTNNGSDPVQFSLPTITGTNAGDFVIASNTCVTVAAGGSCTMNLAFTPSAAGARTASLNIIDTATGSPQTVTLFGNGQVISQLLSASLTTLDFGVQNKGVATNNLSVQITNTGNDEVDISGITISGTNAADFEIVSPYANTCPAVLTPGAACYIYVIFTPSTTAAESATLTIANDSSSGPVMVSLIGVGQTVTKSLVLSAVSLDFGAPLIGVTSGQQLLVTNTGDATVTIYPPAITGVNAANFTVYNDNCGALTPGSACYIYLNFSPSATSVARATLTISSTATGGPLTVALTGTGTAASGAVLNFTNPAAFTNTNVGASSNSAIYVYDVGTANATVSSVVLGGANAGDFSIYNNACATLSPGSYCYVGVTFTPTATGNRTATLTFTDSSPGSPHRVVLAGTGQ